LDPLADFSAIHLFPTIIVFVSCLPIYAAVAMDAQALNWLDYVAATATATAILIELVGDIQLHRFLEHRKDGRNHEDWVMGLLSPPQLLRRMAVLGGTRALWGGSGA
jgi:steroid 5-alpha reductase family enzyme